MVKAYIVDWIVTARGRRRVSAILQWGGQENLSPRDVGLQTVDSIVVSPQSFRGASLTNVGTTSIAIPFGSVAATLGSSGPQGRVRSAGPGSTITLRWATGSTGSRLTTPKAFGTITATGTKTAHAWIVGA